MLLKMFYITASKLHKFFWFLLRKYQLSQFKKCGRDVYIGQYCKFTHENIVLGNDIYIADNAWFSSVHGEIIIGDHVMFGPGVHIHGGNHVFDRIGYYMKENDCKSAGQDGKVEIQDDCWIGARSIILKGVTIGRGSIIAAGAIVSKSIPPYSIYISKSESMVKRRFTDIEVEEHERKLMERNEADAKT